MWSCLLIQVALRLSCFVSLSRVDTFRWRVVTLLDCWAWIFRLYRTRRNRFVFGCSFLCRHPYLSRHVIDIVVFDIFVVCFFDLWRKRNITSSLISDWNFGLQWIALIPEFAHIPETENFKVPQKQLAVCFVHSLDFLYTGYSKSLVPTPVQYKSNWLYYIFALIRKFEKLKFFRCPALVLASLKL